jgi:hypothetical protein
MHQSLLQTQCVVVGVVVVAAAATARLTFDLLPTCDIPKRCASLVFFQLVTFQSVAHFLEIP